ncbi:EmrB/QacA subfamily drug resistance transporter [Streptosporangium album]|uniref:EmrB/QacA subfamily drug resistance transporter n=1 Tax=Streptosporangium album TaxID=47479 RepID=A0A7W7RRF4_9ACTN|nr:MFS transporter [Streptosporangium album]MBB4936774.1 EmrB/QacA subfamily drug resistance transporter [Streptosporangium album]
MTTLDTRPAEASGHAGAAPYKWRWPALFVILAGSVMELLDATVTSIAGPTMQADLGGGTSMIQWLGVAYTLAMTAGLLTGGRLGDIVGRKRMFLIGATGFVVGSLLCAVAVSPETVIAARVVQGLFGAAMVPQGLGMMKEMFPPKELQSAFAAFGPIMGLSAIGGPILAGWLVDADFFGTGWRMIFLINLPLGLVTVAAAMRFLPATRRSGAVRLDLPGALLASLGSLLIVFPLVQGREHGWPAWTFVMMAASVAVFAFFGWYESRRSRRGGDPLIAPSLFRKRAFIGGMFVGTIYFSAFTGFGLVFNLYTQLGLGYTPLKAGLAGVPLSAGMIVGMGVMQAVKRHGRKVLLAGAVIMAAGVVALLLLLGPETGPWRLAPALLVTGLGSGLVMGPYFQIALSGVDPHETGSASGTLTALQQLGAALGVALLGTVFFGALGGDPTVAAQHTFWVVAGMVALTFLTGFLLPRYAREDAEPVR